jgi:hypothetical protein
MKIKVQQAASLLRGHVSILLVFRRSCQQAGSLLYVSTEICNSLRRANRICSL